MVLQKKYRKSAEYVASFDYFDIADGIGYRVYYGAIGTNGAKIVTTQSSIYSEGMPTVLNPEVGIVSRIAQNLTSTNTKYFDFDFDITFNMPKNIKGDLLVQIPLGVHALDAVATNVTMNSVATAYHYDGSTPTSLGTGTSKAFTETIQSDGVIGAAAITLIKINIPNVIHFKKGESLRITTEGWFKSVGDNQETIMIGHDPANRDYSLFGYVTSSVNVAMKTQMSFHVPFVIPI